MFAISKAVSGIFTATSISQLRVSAPAALQQCFYSSHKPKTNALKCIWSLVLVKLLYTNYSFSPNISM
ncbi:hypothetical protein BX661DRAFT_192400 [Kickxella alabastrina]|uniref:uncharacterized protein n=1 Tax=Kickxella alabastrina TaxID=61397 RepID=UPI00222032C6|nr:uncharacterized protein BX661DRAFT_192400 [Kickxella alabastrina]KAI7817830.1 hypothetical protein BX661DRAFT_192400 [Kickxella alabastrina]